MFYRVLTYFPNPVGTLSFPCFVLLHDGGPLSSDPTNVFLPVLWNKLTQSRHHEYILALASEWHHRKDFVDKAVLATLLDELSVGPIRLHSSGSCLRTGVPHLLDSIFGAQSYFLVTSERLSEGCLINLFESDISTH